MAQFHSQRLSNADDAEHLEGSIFNVALTSPDMGSGMPSKIKTDSLRMFSTPEHTILQRQTDSYQSFTLQDARQTDAYRSLALNTVQKTDDYQSFAPTEERQTGGYQQLALQATRQAESDSPVALQKVQTTQSLVLALHSTMQPPLQGKRAPLIIPGERNRQRNTTQLPQVTQHGLNLHLRHGLTLFATLCVLMFTMFSLTPLGSGQSGVAFLDGAANWAHGQQINWNFTAGRQDPLAQQPDQQPMTTTITTAPVVANLPTSQYVAIAHDAAIRYGISPTYFERQINQESGFNPQAMSPAGAVGIAQFLPSTAAGLGVNPYDPIDALNGAARMMANLSAQYGGNYAKALAGYNAGSGAVNYAVSIGGAAWLSYMPAETQNYIRIIMG